jgi:hypothetical protein
LGVSGPLQEIAQSESARAAIELVRHDLNESTEFKRRHWPSDKIMNRRRAYRGDPGVFAWPYATLNAEQGPRPVDNWTFRQINHKVGKLQRVPTRLNLITENMASDPDMRVKLEALKQRLLMKARDAEWKRARRKMLREAAVTGLAVRAIGLDLSGPTPRIETMPVASEEYHRDPTQETLRTSSFSCWKRWVSTERVLDSLRRAGYEGGAGASVMDFAQDGRSESLDIPDDLILERGASSEHTPWVPRDRTLLTDYYRDDKTVDIYYQCPECGEEATVGRVSAQGETFPVFDCPNCDTTLEEPPDFNQMSKGPRYPYGRHIRILGKGSIVFNGPNMLPIEGVHPFIEMPWYDSDYFVGMSEVELLNSPQSMNNVALAMLSDNAIFNTHPKKVVIEGGIRKPGNNSPNDVIEVSQDAISGFKLLPPGPVGEACKILLERSIADTYALAGNDPVAHGSQPETLRSGVGVARVIAASEVSLYLLQDQLFETESKFFEIVRDICRKTDSAAFMDIKNDATGISQPFAYDRTLMQPNIRIQVVADRELDQEREELFSRAVELFTIGDPWIDWDLLHTLSGIPLDILRAAEERIRARSGGIPPDMLGMIMGGQGQPGAMQGRGGAGQPGGTPPPGRSNGASKPQGGGAGQLIAGFAGARAPKQTRPPSRSRGAQTASSPAGGGGSPGGF